MDISADIKQEADQGKVARLHKTGLY